jgi:hypothetical protein
MVKMARKRRSNRGIMWATLLGVGVGAAAYGVGKNRNKLNGETLQNMMSKIPQGGNFQAANLAGLAEFAKEIIPAAGKTNNNNSITTEKNYSESIPSEGPSDKE